VEKALANNNSELKGKIINVAVIDRERKPKSKPTE
jgi:hypothetical protein